MTRETSIETLMRVYLTPEEGRTLARKQRPGVKVVMGAECAREEVVAPRVSSKTLAYGDRDQPSSVADTSASWFEYDCARLIGETRLSAWALRFLSVLVMVSGRMPTAAEVAFFAAKNTSLEAAQTKIREIADA